MATAWAKTGFALPVKRVSKSAFIVADIGDFGILVGVEWMSFGRIYSSWQGKKDSNLRMLESKSSALTSLAIPLQVNLKKSNCKRDFYLALEQFDQSILLEDFAEDFPDLRCPS